MFCYLVTMELIYCKRQILRILRNLKGNEVLQFMLSNPVVQFSLFSLLFSYAVLFGKAYPMLNILH